ncbi:uncharacterized protein [Haliotis cracherodii]|uniref:uncharacterized protein n=1 Tax=Haliotis cracherodii TaxID=6455 RepID=UPI0039E73C37
MGYQQNVELFRNDTKERDLTSDETYSYNPVVHKYDPLVELRPGDCLKTKCVFRSTSKKTTTTFGAGTNDEMCFAIFTYFPAENMHYYCVTWDEVDMLLFDNGVIYGCDYRMLKNESHPERQRLITKVLDNCDPYGGCRTECPAAVAEVRGHPCFSGRLPDYTVSLLSRNPSLEVAKFLAALQSCDCSAAEPPVSPSNGGHSKSITGEVITLMCILGSRFV